MRTLLLAACALGIAAGGCERPAPQVVVPPPKPYAEAVRKRAAAELDGLGPPCPRDAVTPGCSAVHRLIIDHHRDREQRRAARP
jgi:hypothetical protein